MCGDNLILVPYKVFAIVYAINRKVWASNGTTDVSDKGQQIAASYHAAHQRLDLVSLPR